MDVLNPPDAGSSKIEISEYRMLKIVLWLAEFRYSSLANLATLVGLPPTRSATQTSRLFSRLKEMDLVVEGRHPLLNERLYMLGSNAETFALVRGHAFSRLCLDYGTMGTVKSVFHDLSLQRALMRRMDSFKSLFGEYQLKTNPTLSHLNFRSNRPDALSITRKDQVVAYEYEWTGKDQRRIYNALITHATAIDQGHYFGVIYLFPSKKLADRYQEMINAPRWPMYERERGTGHIIPVPDTYFYPKDTRTRFRVLVENYYMQGTGAAAIQPY